MSGRVRKVILTLEVVGIDDSMVLLLLVLIVGEPVLVSELKSIPVDVRIADESKLDVLRNADEVVSESLVEDEESTNVLVTLETLVSVKELELVGEL